MRNLIRLYRLSILLFFTQAIVLISYGQKYAGNWEGVLEVKNRKLKLVLHISPQNGAQYSATMDIAEQKAFNIPASAVNSTDDNITIKFSTIGLTITGAIDSESLLKCVSEQSGTRVFFELKNTGRVTLSKKFNRPQTPIPPFSYISEDVEFDNVQKTVHFGGTFTFPKGIAGADKRYPTVLLITGTGAQDRDETIFEHKPFAVLADFLTKAGYAVLRVDDRETGKTTGNFLASTTGDFANDAEAALSFLKNRKEVDTSKLGLLGHSEGGLIAAMVASRRKDIDFVILIAAPAADPIELFQEQSATFRIAQGVPAAKANELRPLMHDIFEAINSSSDSIIALQQAKDIFNNWQASQSKSTIRSTTGVTDEKSMQAFISQMVARWSMPWNKYFMKLHLADFYKPLSCKVLAVFGEKDIQVDPKINKELLETYFSAKKTGDKEIRVIAGLNHLFQHCKKCNFSEYADIEETLAPELLEQIDQWLKASILN